MKLTLAKGPVINSRFHISWLFVAATLFGFAAASCTGSAGPSGAGGGEVGAQITDNTQVALNPGSTQAGGEGHAQEGKKSFRVTLGTKDGQTNCGLQFSDGEKTIFPSGDQAPTLLSTVAGQESGPFGAEFSNPFNEVGHTSFPVCPFFASILEGRILRQNVQIHFIRLVATFVGPDGKFYQTEPKVMNCGPVCEKGSPCEVCLTLKEESEIAEEDRVHQPASTPLPPGPGIEPPVQFNPDIELNTDSFHLNDSLIPVSGGIRLTIPQR